MEVGAEQVQQIKTSVAQTQAAWEGMDLLDWIGKLGYRKKGWKMMVNGRISLDQSPWNMWNQWEIHSLVNLLRSLKLFRGVPFSKSKKWTCGKLRKLRTRGWETPELNEGWKSWENHLWFYRYINGGCCSTPWSWYWRIAMKTLCDTSKVADIPLYPSISHEISLYPHTAKFN